MRGPELEPPATVLLNSWPTEAGRQDMVLVEAAEPWDSSICGDSELTGMLTHCRPFQDLDGRCFICSLESQPSPSN